MHVVEIHLHVGRHAVGHVSETGVILARAEPAELIERLIVIGRDEASPAD